jgi:hypothetical protein
MSVIGLANQTLTTPALQRIVSRFPDKIPEDVGQYVLELFARNSERSDRLGAQLMDVLAALNKVDITPILLKGTAFLAARPPEEVAHRIVSDLDILVAPEDIEAALAGLSEIGYQTYLRTSDDAAKWYVELERQGDVGMIDLHKNPPGHAFFYKIAGEAKDNCRKTTWRGGTAYIPSATYHAFMLMIHDQFQDADYWIGRMDLRHLLDLHDLANSPEGIDWNLLASFCSGSLAKNAIETQLVTLASLLGTDVPPAMRSRLVPRLQNWRRLTQVSFPVLSDLFLTMMLLDYRNYRRELGGEERKANDLRPRTWVLPKWNTARFLFDLSREHRAGKI